MIIATINKNNPITKTSSRPEEPTIKAIPKIKKIIRSVDMTEARKLADNVLGMSSSQEINRYINEEMKKLKGLNVGMLGDLRYGRTVHSLSHALAKFDNKLSFISPDSLSMPSYVTDDLSCEWSSHNSIEDVLNDLDVLYVTRIQKERFPDLEEYKKVASAYIIDSDLLKNAKSNMRILHPLPRVTEISTDVDETKHAAYFRQAFNGVPVRMALLEQLIGGKK